MTMSIRADTAPEPAITGNYRALLDNSTIPIALVSTRGKPSFVAASRGFLDAVGKQRRAVVGRGLDEVVCAAALSRLQASIQRCLISRETVRRLAQEVYRRHGYDPRYADVVAQVGVARVG